MATPPPNMEGGPPQVVAQPPGTDMTGICFKDQLWLSSYPLDRNLVFDYFAISPFYDWTCNNEQLRQRAIHPLDISHLSKMTGIEYMLVYVARTPTRIRRHDTYRHGDTAKLKNCIFDTARTRQI
ncbi:hypothetical protein ACLB2K_055292 [Fragaria x ananassa]